jgi:DNA invertase Pin-like site-specific DNA recombinase
MKIGYVRVSTVEQNTARQEVLMEQLGVERVYVEKASGKSAKKEDRPILEEMMNFIREGDTLVVESISRFARSTVDLLNLVARLEGKGVEFVSQKENIDTSTPQGKFMLTVFAALAQLEREQTKQRQAEGIAIAKAQGKYKGRKPIEIDEKVFDETYKRVIDGEMTNNYAMSKLGLKRNTYYKFVADYKKRHEN